MKKINLPILKEEILPSFPCNLHKKPLTKNGYKDATTDPDLFASWIKGNSDFLYAVPTGAITGFDILDIDPVGLEWLRQQLDIQLTRIHETRRNGFHLFFQHFPDLRNSTSKIASGIDVRSDGGYIIWWPNHDFSIINPHIILPWPQWLLDLQFYNNKKQKQELPLFSNMAVPNPNLFKEWFTFNECMQLIGFDINDEEIINEIHMQLIEESRGLGTAMLKISCPTGPFSRESKYAIQSAAQTVSFLSNSIKGTRNNNLNIKALVLGRIMARSWTPPRNLIRALWRGAIYCGLVNTDGPAQTINTIVSGLKAGLKDPYPDIE